MLSENAMDALSELFNVGLHRAAASLSSITGQPIVVDRPKLVICEVSDIERPLAELVGGEIATVHQIFGGAVAGDAVLLIEHEKAAALARLMTGGEAAAGGRLDQSGREVLVEIGNIVLGACLSGFGDMLKVPVSLSVPRIHIDSLRTILASLVGDGEVAQFAVIVSTRFRLSQLAVDGYMIIAVGAKSLNLISTTLGVG